jgi:hypothetical protein
MYGIWPDRGALVGINYYVAYMFLVLSIKTPPVLVYRGGALECEDSICQIDRGTTFAHRVTVSRPTVQSEDQRPLTYVTRNASRSLRVVLD